MNLGNSFPADLRLARVERVFKPGAVFYLEIEFPEITKNKYLVLVDLEGDDCFHFIVNSEPNAYIEERAELRVCQVSIDAASHDFLRYDSMIACHEVLTIPKTEVVSALMRDMSLYKGQISDSVRDEIVAAVKHAETLSPIQQKSILSSLAT